MCCHRLTNVQHDKFDVNNNTFYSVNSKIKVNWSVKEFKGKNVKIII